jgi:tetratricopeptide (TPR) repeat protein
MMASIALGGRARDRAFLVGAAGGPYRRSSRHLDHALERFPNDPRLLMARVVTATFFPGTNTRARVDDFTQFVHDPVVGAEAEVRIAQLHIDRRDYEAALAHARRAAEIAKQASTVYIAHFLAGRSLEAQRRPADAARAYEAALNAVPDGQSASLMLAKLMVFSSQPAVASTIVERSLDAHPFQDDPWRLFPYGEFMHWPVLIAELRRAIE